MEERAAGTEIRVRMEAKKEGRQGLGQRKKNKKDKYKQKKRRRGR